MKKLFFPAFLIILCLLLSSWGSKGHKKISQNFAACLPARMSFLKPVWTNFIMTHASDADNRKSQDPDESPRHYIDIDSYTEFLQTGRISMDYDSLVDVHGYNFVIGEGVLPWATRITYDSLKSCFQRRDWNRSMLFAADLGHYVGDGHMPLHITNNYNGQMTGQTGIHSRYESSLISRYEAQINYPADSAQLIPDVQKYIFDNLYNNYRFIDSLLLADTYAKTIAGGTGSETYYQTLWTKTGGFTVKLMSHASNALASLIYTAWVEAGSPMIYPNAIDEPETPDQPVLLQIYPNPAVDYAWFSLATGDHPVSYTLSIFDLFGNLKDTIAGQSSGDEIMKIKRNIHDMAPGLYICVFQSGTFHTSGKFMVVK